MDQNLKMTGALLVGMSLASVAQAAFFSANFKGSQDAAGRFYFHDPANWGGNDPSFEKAASATDPGLGLNAGTQWFTLADDFVTTRLVNQAKGAKHGIDLAGHTLTLKGSMRSYTDDNGFSVSNGTFAIVNEYQVGSTQSGYPNPSQNYLIVTGPNTAFSASTLYLNCGTNNFCTIQDGATVNAALVFGEGGTNPQPVEGNVLRVTGANTRFICKTSAFNLFGSDIRCRNLLEVSGGARFEGVDKLYFKGIENRVRFADDALPTTPDTLSIIGGTSNVLEVSGSQFVTTGKRLDITAGSGHRISLQDGTHYYFETSYAVFGNGVTDSTLEITGGSVFARTNGNHKTATSASATAANNTIRIVGPGSKLLYDAYVYVGDDDSGATMLVEDGGMLEHSGRNSGGVYVPQKQTSGNALVVRGAGSKVKASTVYLGANGASNCRVDVSDRGAMDCTFVMGWWKRDPADASFSANPGGTNVLSIVSGGCVTGSIFSVSGVGNVVAVTNGELVLTSTSELLPDRRYALAIPDPIFETEAALAKLQTIPRDMQIRIGGSRSAIKTTQTANGSMYFAKGTDFSFEIPEAGYEQVPIQSAKNIEIVGCGKITVDADAWIAAHPEDKVVLMQAAGSISIDDASLAAFNSALPSNYKVRVKGKQLLFEPVKGLFLLVK